MAMECPECGGETLVYNSRPWNDIDPPLVRRWRECKGCGIKFATHEVWLKHTVKKAES